jgi:ATP-dependent protease ClpP protease subunit
LENFKYIKNITEGVAEIRIYEPIGIQMKNGVSYGVSGSAFASEMAYLKDVCNKINIRINSEGGSILDGYAIFSSIVNSPIETESFIDGIAASTAGWCALAANKCSIMDYGTLMVHGASGSNDAELINMANGSISKMLSNRTGMSIEETDSLMKKETFFRAFDQKDKETLLNKKFVDAVVSTDKKIKIKKSESLSNMALIYNQLIKPKMDKINNVLDLKNDASEESAVKAIEAIKAEKETATAELETVKNELKALKEEKAKAEEAAKVALKEKAEALVNKAVADKKITDAEKASTLANASASEASFEFVKNMLDKVSNVKVASKVFDLKNAKGEASEKDSWSFDDWSKKDPNGLLEMQNSTPELFNELYKKQYPNAK